MKKQEVTNQLPAHSSLSQSNGVSFVYVLHKKVQILWLLLIISLLRFFFKWVKTDNIVCSFCSLKSQKLQKWSKAFDSSGQCLIKYIKALIDLTVNRERSRNKLWNSAHTCVFTFDSPTFYWRKIEKLLGTRDRNLADKWIPAICRNTPLFAETPPSQTEVILMDSEVKGNPNPNVPLTQVSVQHSRCMVRALLHQPEIRDTKMKRNEERSWGKTVIKEAKPRAT